MKGVEVLVAVVSAFQLNWVYWEVFECLIEDNLMENCTVVLKVLSDEMFPGHHLQITAKNAMQNCGFVGDKWKGSACKLNKNDNCIESKNIGGQLDIEPRTFCTLIGMLLPTGP